MIYIKKIKKLNSTINSIPELKFGIIILVCLLFIAFIGPYLCRFEPDFLSDDMLSPPSQTYWFGTDGVGCDIFSLVINGTKTSIKIGVVVALISSVIGTVIGAISGYFGGVTDIIISEVLNVFMMIPSFFLMVIVISVYGSNLNNMILIMSLTSWIGTARLMRGQAISLREKTYVKSAVTLGEGKFSIIFKYIIPNGIFPVIADATMTISGAILSEAGLSFLGLGDPNIVSWGKIIASGRRYLPNSWWICTFPGFAIIITVLAFYLIGDGINKAIAPKQTY